MPENTEQTNATDEQITKLEAILEEAKELAVKAEQNSAVAKLNNEDRETFDGFSKEDQDKWFSSDEATRDEVLKAKKKVMEYDEDEDDGKDDDEEEGSNRKKAKKSDEMPDAVAKAVNELQEKVSKAEARASAAEHIAKEEQSKRRKYEFEKRASIEFPNLPATDVEKGAALGALEKLDQNEREIIERLLKAGDAVIATSVLKPIGKDGSGTHANTDAWTTIEKKSEALAKEKSISKAVAMNEFLGTQEGTELYQRYLNNEKTN